MKKKSKRISIQPVTRTVRYRLADDTNDYTEGSEHPSGCGSFPQFIGLIRSPLAKIGDCDDIPCDDTYTQKELIDRLSSGIKSRSHRL